MKKCSIKGCGKKLNSRGFCSAHYKKWRIYGDPMASVRVFYKGVACSVDGCDLPAKNKGMCIKHAARVRIHGDPNTLLIAPAGSGWTSKRGYRQLSGSIEHTLIAERVLGKKLPPGAEVHHVNEDKSDNRHSNLVICQDSAYHKLLHARMRAYEACGHADWRKCSFCKEYDDKNNLVLIPGKRQEYAQIYHRECRNKSRRI